MRVFTHTLTNDEIQPVEVPTQCQFLEISYMLNGTALLHALGDFSTSSVTRFVCRTTLREKLPTESIRYIGSCVHQERGREYFFEAYDESEIDKWRLTQS